MIKMYFDYMRARFGSKKGQGMVEYGLIIGIVAVILIAALGFLRGPLTTLFTNIGNIISGNTPSVTPGP
jgi:Flp pilus assembly protein, pilin Flp